MKELDDYIRSAMERIEEMYLETKGKFFISFSGGKDSTVLLQLVKLCYEIGTIPTLPKAIFCNTRTEMQCTIEFVKWCKESGWYENIEIIYPEKTFYNVIKENGYPAISKMKSGFINSFQKENAKSKSRINILINWKSKNGNTSRFRLSNSNIHMLHPDFGLKISDNCCKVLKKNPFKKYALENDILGTIDGEMISEGGLENKLILNE